MKSFLKVIVGWLFRVKLAGAFAQPTQPRTVYVANHTSLLDGLLMALFLPGRPTFLVHTTVLENPLFRFLLKGVKHFAVDPTSPLALKAIIRLLEDDQSVVIFPEGRITVTGSLMKVYYGAAFVAAKAGADVVAVHMDGPSISRFSYLAGKFPRRWFPKITLTFQPATKISMPNEGSGQQKRSAVGEEMRRLLQRAAFDARKDLTLFQGFLAAVKLHGRSKKVAEDIQFVPAKGLNGNDNERKAVVNQSYGQVLRAVLAVQRIASKISQPGDRIGVLLPNSTGAASVVLGLSSGGRVPAMLNFTAGVEGMQNALIASDTKIVLTSRRFLDLGKLQHVVDQLKGVTVYYMEDLRKQFGLADKLWLMLYALRNPAATAHPVSPDQPAVILFTSGSEGKPKGVVHTHRSLLANVAQVNAVADFGPADKFLVALPLFHSFGLTAGTLLPLLNGIPVFFFPSPLAYRVIPEVVYDRRATVLFGTSTFLAGYAKYAHPFDFQTLRYVVAGAEKLSEAVRETWASKFGIRILSGYGITETAPVLSVNTPMTYKAGTVGPFLPGVDYKLEPVPGVADGGLLHVKAANLMAGYMLYDKPGVISAFSSSVGEGWYSTGDIVTVDAEGYVTIVGRVKRFAKLAGEMVSLEAVEKLALVTSPKALHAAVARPDAAKGEAIVLFTTDADLTAERLNAMAKDLGVAAIAVPRKISVVPAIPLLGTGKTDYVTLNAMALAV